MRTAESAVLTDWPPQPLARKVSILRSSSFISSSCSSISGVTSMRANDVSRVPPELNGLIRTSLWTPCSSLRNPYANGPLTMISALFMPASSPCVFSKTSAGHSCFSIYLRYMRRSISAQSWASVPPVPAWIERIALELSYLPFR